MNRLAPFFLVPAKTHPVPGLLQTREHKWPKLPLALTMRLATMADLAEKTMATKCRRSRTSFTEEQLKILVQAFSQNPYPGYTAKQRLAVEINAEESRIQIWFQNRRARHGFLKRPKKNLDPSKDHASPIEKIQEEPGVLQSVENRRCRTSFTSSQLQTLKNAFTENPYPGIDSREQLAEEIGVPESRVQIWFQNRRARLRVQRKRGLEEALYQRQNQGQDL
ncbi:PREDICTED: double homeobox protein A [Bison bison bison]|uniref:Double homeobox protein A n=1 Tax=Bison bison bison TaxID=43346 RepID=A0A6P3IXX3_BISBB|nr:PREDICTED: double homeobox protein A [Bison bison bison]